MRLAAIAMLLTLAAPAYAQDKPAPPPGFEPFTVTEQDWRQLQAWLNEQPYKFTQPIIEWAGQLETRAQKEAARKGAEKPAPKAD